MKLGEVIDRVIGVFSPKSELNRLAARQAIGKVRSTQYAAAKSTPSTHGW